MTQSRLDLVLHPVRLRLIHALQAAGGGLTTSELCERLPDLPKASLYRQVGKLMRGGVFEVESERRVRGAVERRYRISARGAAINLDEARAMTLEDHRRAFATAMAVMITDFEAYLDGAAADPVSDKVSYRQFPLWLDPAERDALVADFTALIMARAGNGPGGGRKPYRASSIFFPAAEA